MIRKIEYGFTLAELIIILAIFGVLTAVAVPAFMSMMPTYRLNGASRQILGDLMAARMNAVKENNRFRVFFLEDNHQYKILDDDNNNNAEDSGEWTDTKDIQNEYSDVTFSATANPIFYPRGTAFGSTITLTNPAGSKSVTVALSGRVKIN